MSVYRCEDFNFPSEMYQMYFGALLMLIVALLDILLF